MTVEWEWVGPAIGALTLLALFGALVRGMWRAGRKINHFLDDVSGAPARPGVPAHPGLVERVATMEARQASISQVAVQAAQDASVTRSELTRNGGDTTTKDVIHKALRAAEETNSLMRRHMENGKEIMAVGIHNDRIIIAAIEALGGHVGEFMEYPPVDTGEDDYSE